MEIQVYEADQSHLFVSNQCVLGFWGDSMLGYVMLWCMYVIGAAN